VPWRFSTPPRLKAAHSRRTPKRFARNERPAGPKLRHEFHQLARRGKSAVTRGGVFFISDLLNGFSAVTFSSYFVSISEIRVLFSLNGVFLEEATFRGRSPGTL
jgi:hypothetical protein